MKKNIALYFGIVLVTGIMLSSCKQDDCEEVVLPWESLEELYGCSDTRNELIVDITNSAILITNQTDYDAQVEGPCSPAIDFVNYDLVIGKRTTTQLVDTIYYDYLIACPGANKTLNVEIMQGTTVQADNPVFHVLIPKLGNGENIALNVYVKNI